MICPECNSTINDDVKVCPECGYPIRENSGETGNTQAEIKTDSGEKMKNSSYDIVSIIGCIAGAFAVIMGLSVLFMNNGNDPTYAQFGADFYTEIYAAARQAAINTGIIKTGIGSLLIANGVGIICRYLPTLKVDNDK